MQVLLFFILSGIAAIALLYGFSTKSVFAYIVAIGLFFAVGQLVLLEGIEKETEADVVYSGSDVDKIVYTYENIQDSGTFAVGWIYTGFGMLLAALFFIYALANRKQIG